MEAWHLVLSLSGFAVGVITYMELRLSKKQDKEAPAITAQKMAQDADFKTRLFGTLDKIKEDVNKIKGRLDLNGDDGK